MATDNNNKSVKDTFCPIPFLGVYYRGDDQKINSCCMELQKNQDHIQDFNGDIARWWQSDSAIERRTKFLNNEWPDSCKACQVPEQSGRSSPRTQWKWVWDMADKLKDLNPGKQIYNTWRGNITGKPVYFDYRPDNLCNLGCAMCSPNASSVLEKMVIENPELNHHDVLSNSINQASSTDAEYATILSALGPHTRRIKLNGGEPTISSRIKDVYKICIDNNWAKDIQLQFTTNFTNTNKTFTDILPKFGGVSLTASLDGTGATYDYTRAPAKWSKVESNIRKVVADGTLPDFVFGVNLVWCATTCFTVKQWLPELLELVYWVQNFKYDGVGIKNKSQGTAGITTNQCWTPKWVALSVLPEEFKTQIYRDLEYVISLPRTEEILATNTKMQVAVDALVTGLRIFKFDRNHLTLFQNSITIYDKARGTDITTLHPKYKELLEH